jgi:mono/diheme cytochrome c family protein
MRHLYLFGTLTAAFGILLFMLTPNGEANYSSDRSAGDLYKKYCASCHGKDGRGKTFKGKLTHARDLTDRAWQDDMSDERFFNSIMKGKNKMPAFSKKLSESEIESLVRYVRALL